MNSPIFICSAVKVSEFTLDSSCPSYRVGPWVSCPPCLPLHSSWKKPPKHWKVFCDSRGMGNTLGLVLDPLCLDSHIIYCLFIYLFVVAVQSLSHIWLFRPHGLQLARLPCPSLSPGVCSNSCPLSWWCHPTISSSPALFCFCLQSCPASGSFLMSRLFASGGQSIGASASASVLPKNIHSWFPLGWTGLSSLWFLYKIGYVWEGC